MIIGFKEIEKFALNLDRKNKALLTDLLLQCIYDDIDLDIEQASIQEVQKRKNHYNPVKLHYILLQRF